MRDLTLEKYRNAVYLNFEDEDILRKQREAIVNVRSNFGKEYQLYINGVFKKGEKKPFKSVNPSNTDETIGLFESASKNQAAEALQHAWTAFEKWKHVSVKNRADYLFKAAEIIRKRRLEINAWMICECGKNYVEADADTCEAIDFLTYYAYEALRMDKGMGVLNSKGDYNKTIYTPMGAGISISPWNFPFAIFTGMAMAPIVAGNTVVAKPAPDTPKMGHLLTEILDEIELPEGVFNYVTGDDIEVGESLAKNERTRFISFTGSMKVGQHLTEIAASPHENQTFLKRIITEMGGKNSIVVDSDADLDNAADSIVQSAFGYQGQKCSACSRVIAHKAIHDKLLKRVIERTKNLDIGNAKDNHSIGPVINQKAVDKIMFYIDIGKREGELITGGKRSDNATQGFFIEPTIFSGIQPDDRIAQEEIFGPVTAFIKGSNTDELMTIANNTRYGLTGAYHSKDEKKIERALREINVGNLYINRGCTGSLVGAQPFGGFNMSGNDAKAGGRDYLLNFLLPRSFTYRPGSDVEFELEYFKYADK